MPITGDTGTMSLPDLLQWLGASRKTGTLELERNQITRRIVFRDGHVVGCCSDDPPSLLGQFLLAQGKINESQLREALARQQIARRNLGAILIAMGAISADEVERQVAAKAEETISGLFDWQDATFRFHEGAAVDPYVMEVNLRVEDVLLRGLRRFDEMKRMRDVFQDRGVVLRRTGKVPPAEITGPKMARRVFESIDGRRTLAELLLHAHASEFAVTRFLFQLLRAGFVEVAEVKPLAPAAAAQEAVPEAAAPASTEAAAPAPDLSGEIELALRLTREGKHETALTLLNAAYRIHPTDATLRRMIINAELAFREDLLHRGLSATKIPVRRAAADAAPAADPSPTESFLLSLVDGGTDIKSILWLAPMRELDVLRALRRLVDAGLVELREPAPASVP